MKCKQKSTGWWFWDNDYFSYQKGAHLEDKRLLTSISLEHRCNTCRWGGPRMPVKKKVTCWRLRSRRLKEAETLRTSSGMVPCLIVLLLDFLIHEQKRIFLLDTVIGFPLQQAKFDRGYPMHSFLVSCGSQCLSRSSYHLGLLAEVNISVSANNPGLVRWAIWLRASSLISLSFSFLIHWTETNI